MKAAFTIMILAACLSAAPAPPEIIVNNATMECSTFNAGDECVSCEIPDGWVSLGRDTRECPEGYAEVTAARNCTPGRNARCCSEGHSGGLGECDMMVVNDLLKQCKFSEDGAVPPGWAGKPEGADDWDWQCPEGYGWPSEGLPGGPCFASSVLLCGLAIFTFNRKS